MSSAAERRSPAALGVVRPSHLIAELRAAAVLASTPYVMHDARRRWILAAALTSVLSQVDPSVAGPRLKHANAAPTRLDVAIVAEANRARAHAGIPVLRADSRLHRAARLHAQQMAQFRVLQHEIESAAYPHPIDRLTAVKYVWQMRAENIAFGDFDARSLVAGWMASAAHRRHILNPAYTETGIGHARDRTGRSYYVQVFARPRTSARRR
jgi:uncharacterized protein YkwD